MHGVWPAGQGEDVTGGGPLGSICCWPSGGASGVGVSGTVSGGDVANGVPVDVAAGAVSGAADGAALAVVSGGPGSVGATCDGSGGGTGAGVSGDTPVNEFPRTLLPVVTADNGRPAAASTPHTTAYAATATSSPPTVTSASNRLPGRGAATAARA